MTEARAKKNWKAKKTGTHLQDGGEKGRHAWQRQSLGGRVLPRCGSKEEEVEKTQLIEVRLGNRE